MCIEHPLEVVHRPAGRRRNQTNESLLMAGLCRMRMAHHDPKRSVCHRTERNVRLPCPTRQPDANALPFSCLIVRYVRLRCGTDADCPSPPRAGQQCGRFMHRVSMRLGRRRLRRGRPVSDLRQIQRRRAEFAHTRLGIAARLRLGPRGAVAGERVVVEFPSNVERPFVSRPARDVAGGDPACRDARMPVQPGRPTMTKWITS
jgi:hypothetical protein